MTSSDAHFTTIDEYIAIFPPAVQEKLQLLKQIIKEMVPEAEEAIKYRMPTFVFHGNLVYFAAWKKHIGLYPITSSMEASLPELAAYATSGRGTIKFPLSQPLPVSLIQNIVAFRVKENLENKDKTAE
ncbi:hypothetical protein SD80_012100 [Scytonema tolypothrichoides VB-61278]|nr:hypothetical protein SD80_012100 [Scytonema tolypothrichoides VB-61278]